MAGSTEFDIRNPSSAVSFDITVAKGAVQTDCFFVMNMIEQDGLINGYPSINGKDREEDLFGLDLKSMVGNDSKKEDKNNSSEKTQFLLH
jgi:hypothetical protein